MIEATDQTLNTELDIVGDDLALVSFHADWCRPCKMYTPVLEQFSETVPVIELDADENPDSMKTYKVMGLPTVLVFRNGNVVDRLVGARPLAKLERDVEKWR